MKFSLIPVSFAALVLCFSTTAAFAGESEASTSASFGGEGMSSSWNNSQSSMQNNSGPTGLDQNLWGRNNYPGYNPNLNNNIPNTNSIPLEQRAALRSTGLGSANPSMQVQTYDWQRSKYKPYSFEPPAQYRSSQARTAVTHAVSKAASKKPTAGTQAKKH